LSGLKNMQSQVYGHNGGAPSSQFKDHAEIRDRCA
jgi:hypothetical protein